MWEKGIDIRQVQLLRTSSRVYFGVGAIARIADIAAELKGEGIDSILVVSGRSAYKSCGAWDYVRNAFESNSIRYANYDRVTPNPTTTAIDEAAEIGRSIGAKAVIAIGGGSPIDAGKSAAILLANPGVSAEDVYTMKFAPAKALPIIVVNLTHGTGSESNRFAVASILEKEYKPAIAYDCLYPRYAIDDPALMTGLSPKQTIFVSVDAVNHVIEAATSKAASAYSILLAEETVRLVAKYLPIASREPENLEARYYLAYAALLGGVSFDNGLLHFTHALEHPLSAVQPDLSHGLGLAMLLPAVIKAIYGEAGDVLSSVLAPIVPGLTGRADEALDAAKAVERWLQSVGIPEKLGDLGFSEADVPKLTDLAFDTPSLGGLLSIAPVAGSRENVERIYHDSIRTLA